MDASELGDLLLEVLPPNGTTLGDLSARQQVKKSPTSRSSEMTRKNAINSNVQKVVLNDQQIAENQEQLNKGLLERASLQTLPEKHVAYRPLKAS